jgi:hypothetical protein
LIHGTTLFNLFSKKYKPLEDYPEGWTIGVGTDEGLIVRINAGLEAAAGHSVYPIKVGIAVPIKSGTDIFSIKDKVEDELVGIWERTKNGVLVAVITRMNDPVFIEMLSYSKADTDFATLHEELKSRFADEDVQMYAEYDQSWSTYKDLLP